MIRQNMERHYLESKIESLYDTHVVMKKRFSIYALWLAGIMFLLHSVMPHHHHETVSMEMEHEHAVEHIFHLLHEHEEENEHSHEQCHEHSITEYAVAANSQQQQTNMQWHQLFALPVARIQIPEPSSLSLGIELWGNAAARVLSPHNIGHGLRAPPSV